MIELILGLGNAGEQYVHTRHNIGFDVLDLLSARLEAETQPEKDYCRSAIARVGDSEIVLAWPTTLMNRSGLAAGDLLDRLGLTPAEMLAVVDDFDLPLGRLRFRAGGSGGGHNGLASIIEQLETEDFPRLRLGIGPPTDKESVTGFVLTRFGLEESDRAEKMIAIAAEAIIFAIGHRLEEAMSKYNIDPALPEET